MSLTDLLELCLNLLYSLIFKVLNLFKCALYYTKSFRIDLCCCQQLIYLCVFGLQALLDCLKLALKD